MYSYSGNKLKNAVSVYQALFQGVLTVMCPVLPATTATFGNIDPVCYALMEKGRDRSCTRAYVFIYYKKSTQSTG